MHDKTKLELGNLINLETLENFSTKHCSVKDLQLMTKLRNLSIYIEGQECIVKTLSSSLSEFRQLEDLSIYDEEVDEKEGFVLNCVHLKKLTLRIYMPRLPDEQHFPSHLTTISLTYCRLVEDPMPILEKLVQLKKVKLGDQSFSGRRMVCLSRGFPQLQELSIQGLKEWEEWIVEEGSLPLLHSLSIEWCVMLKELPDGLRFIYSLKDLTVGQIWKERLSEGGEDYYKVTHIPSVKFD
ncbi:unnamed protein product [Arabidopsis lyrata]|nr:unnamed protein product [Arabidopsis lyrata]